MKQLMIRGALAAALLTVVNACATKKEHVAPMSELAPTTQKIPAAKAEFRGVWVASVENINWPSKPGLTTEQQQKELKYLLDRAVEMKLNAVLLQVRPCADALYDSKLEPWSPYLTGEMGKAPEPYYDPLAFAVEEAHKRGLELHAWLNPFRVKQRGAKYEMSADSVAVKHPDWVKDYGGMLWMDPGEPGARDHSVAVVTDLVKRYDLDGVHIDDYFYPYKWTDPKTKKEVEFPDSASYAKHGNGMDLGDWRRSNINDFVKRMYTETKAAKPWVKVGISPFGIWRPGNPAQIKGFDAYAQLYGDAKLWMKEGWGDYFTPQLYWAIDKTEQSYPVLLSWWMGQNPQGRHVWPGLYSSRTDGPRAAWEPTEVEYQIRIARGMTVVSPSSGPGTIHFSASFLKPLRGTKADAPLFTHLLETVYADGAIIPPSPWLAASGSAAPASPRDLEVEVEDDEIEVKWHKAEGAGEVFGYVIQWTRSESETAKWEQAFVGASAEEMEYEIQATDVKVVSVSAVDRVGRVSAPVSGKIVKATVARK